VGWSNAPLRRKKASTAAALAHWEATISDSREPCCVAREVRGRSCVAPLGHALW
jgi:hypothetical protein